MRQIEQIFEAVMNGNLKRFPLHTWTKDEYGYNNFNRCLQHLSDKLKLTREQIVDIDHNFIRKYKLRGGLAMLYGENIKTAIINAFPEHDLMEWEFFRTSKNEEFVQFALREIIKRRGWNREIFLEDRSNLYKDKDMLRIIDWMMKHNYDIAPSFKKWLPEYSFSLEELTKRINREKRIKSIRHTFEYELKWSREDIIEKMNVQIAKTYFAQPYSEYRNVLKMVQAVYPEIEILRSMEFSLTTKQKEEIWNDVQIGFTTKQITHKYGISRTTFNVVKRSFLANKKTPE